MNIRIWIMPLLAGALLSGSYFLPKSGEMASSAISMDLPDWIGDWEFRHKPPSQEEIDLLAEDTEFAKATCLKPRYGEYDPQSGLGIPDRIDLSIVLSGHDLNNSIHRPERCMPSQGHTIGSNESRILEMPNGQLLSVQRLQSVQSIATNPERTEYVQYQCLTYYFFVGHRMTTEDHIERTLVDIKDRLLYGMDQRWAYVSASMWYGDLPWIRDELSVEEADKKLQRFLVDLAVEQIDWDQLQ